MNAQVQEAINMSKDQEFEDENIDRSNTLEDGINVNTADAKAMSLGQVPIKIPHDTTTDKTVMDEKSNPGQDINHQ